jgi:hypothetical protein
MNEQWKQIPGFEGLYLVSNTGKIKSLRKWKRGGCPDEYILNPTVANNGYYQVTLYDGSSRKKFQVHRLVASAFVNNPNGYDFVNHIDEDKLNNLASNLEWCTTAYNNSFGTARLRQSITSGQKVDQFLPNGIHLATYESVGVASFITKISSRMIKQCCFGKTVTAAGFMWKYATD